MQNKIAQKDTPNDATKSSPSKGIFLLPNLLTTAGLFWAFYAVVAAFKTHFESAAIAIFVAMIADALDGRVARMTKTASDFGREYDSLADMVSFGVAPALVIYSWALFTLGKAGWLAAFFYTATAGLRLARFNTRIADVPKGYFQGLPSPSAAAILASLVWLAHSNQWQGHVFAVICAVVTVIVGLLMVSNIPYHSFKKFSGKGRVPFVTIVIVVGLFVAISINPPLVLFSGFGIYVLSGPIVAVKNYFIPPRQNGPQSTP
jgi:CDP-diacylglycerol---serine O-phosphatidyltransferase